MPSVQDIVLRSIKKKIQKSPLLSKDVEFINSLKVTFFGGVLNVDYLDEPIPALELEKSKEESTGQTVEVSMKVINPIVSTARKVAVETGIQDALPSLLDKMLNL